MHDEHEHLTPLEKFAHRLAEDLRHEHLIRAENRLLRRKPISVHVWVDPELHAEIVSLARFLNISQANLLRYLIRTGMADDQIRGTDFTAPTRMLFGRDPGKHKTSLDPNVPALHRAPKGPPKFGEM